MLGSHEDALIAALANHRDIKGRVRTVDGLPRLFGDALLQRYVVDAPALYVVPGRITMKDDLATLEFTVAGVVRNAAGQGQARKGDGIDLGCDHLLVLAVRALNAQRLGNCTWSATAAEMADDDLFVKNGIVAIEIKFTGSPIALDCDFGEAQMAELDEFTALHVDVATTPVTSADQANWLQTPPDYSNSRPDLQADIALPGSPE
jgi:phage gp37-like protein